MKILYVEDVAPNLYLVERIAMMGRHEVLHYSMAEEALANLASDQPDIILADVHLEGEMDGIAFVREVRAKGWDVPVVVVTAYATPEVRERSFAAGCDEFCAKPLQVRHFWRLIQQYDAAAPARET